MAVMEDTQDALLRKFVVIGLLVGLVQCLQISFLIYTTMDVPLPKALLSAMEIMYSFLSFSITDMAYRPECASNRLDPANQYIFRLLSPVFIAALFLVWWMIGTCCGTARNKTPGIAIKTAAISIILQAMFILNVENVSEPFQCSNGELAYIGGSCPLESGERMYLIYAATAVGVTMVGLPLLIFGAHLCFAARRA